MDVLLSIVRWLIVALGLLMAGGTLLSRLHSSHWFVRGWDFPRVQISFLALLSGGLYAVFFTEGTAWGWLFIGLCVACAAWQFYRIFPYVPLAPPDVEEATRATEAASLRLVASNVLMENDQYDRWLGTVRGADPDLILAVEVDERWDEQIAAGLAEDYPHSVRQPQENYFGMVLYSRLKLIDPELRFIVQDDIPSIHTGVELPSGQRVYVHGVHPRPPEPLRDEDSTARDAEVVIVGREIEEEGRPTIIAGDFNDVAWSHTSELFQHVSHLLDPRKGRGFFNTFDARYPLLRFPLDHVFHSNEFKLLNLKRLPFVGSDHFPVCISLSYEPSAPAEQPEPERRAKDEEEAQEKVEQAVKENGADVMQNEGAHPEDEKSAPPDLDRDGSRRAKEEAAEAVSPRVSEEEHRG